MQSLLQASVRDTAVAVYAMSDIAYTAAMYAVSDIGYTAAVYAMTDIAYTAAVYAILLQASVRDTAAVDLVAPSTDHKCMNMSNVTWIIYY